MPTRSDIVQVRKRVFYCGDRFFDCAVFYFPAHSLHFRDINHGDPQSKLRDIAQLRYFKAKERGEDQPIVITFLLLDRDRPLHTVFDDLDPVTEGVTESGARLISANSFITYTMRTLVSRGWLHYQNRVWKVVVPDSEENWRNRARAVVRLLSSQNRLHFASGFDRRPAGNVSLACVNSGQNLVAIGHCGFVRDFVWKECPRLAFNTGFFLLENEDFLSHHSALGAGYNLWVADGVICRPPLYRRGALFYDGRWHVGKFGLDDLQVTLPNDLVLRPAFSPQMPNALPFTLNGASDITLFTRYYGVVDRGYVLGYTPFRSDCIELTIVDRQIVGWKTGGGLQIPQNGFVISFAPGVLSRTVQRELENTLLTRFSLVYEWIRPEHRSISRAVQAGPILLQNGQPVLDKMISWHGKEQFWPSRISNDGERLVGVAPTDYKADIDCTRAGRVGLGIDAQGDIVLMTVAGVNSGMGVCGVDSDGVTLAELTELLAGAGAIDAVNMDGGGSTQAYYLGGQAIVPGDRRGLPQVHYERMIPSLGVVF